MIQETGEFDEIGLPYDLPKHGNRGGGSDQVALGGSPSMTFGPASHCSNLLETQGGAFIPGTCDFPSPVNGTGSSTTVLIRSLPTALNSVNDKVLLTCARRCLAGCWEPLNNSARARRVSAGGLGFGRRSACPSFAPDSTRSLL